MFEPAHERDPDATRERELTELLHRGDPAALELLADYGCRIESILTRKFGAFIAKEDLRDIAAETLLRAFQTGRRYDRQRTRLITWLSVIGHYLALQFLRKHRFLNERTLDQVADCMAEQIEAQDGTPQASEQPSPAIEALLQRLSPRRARVIRMHYYDGLSIEQIADLLNISPGGVRSHLSRAHKDLRGLMGYRD